MTAGYIPDTNIISAFLRHEKNIQRRLLEVDSYLSAIVVAELYKGAFGSPISKKEKLLADVRRLLAISIPLVGIDEATSERFGFLAAQAKELGNSIGDNDLWIAAQAMRNNYTVVTRDDDFKRIPGLAVVKW